MQIAVDISLYPLDENFIPPIKELIERLVPLIPPPRAHQVRYHGILAPGASYRDRVVPGEALNGDALLVRDHDVNDDLLDLGGEGRGSLRVGGWGPGLRQEAGATGDQQQGAGCGDSPAAPHSHS